MESNFENLVDILIKATKDGIIVWEKTSNPKEYLSTTIPASPAGIYEEDDYSTNTPYVVFYLLDDKGNDTLRVTKHNGDEGYAKFRSLYECIQSMDAGVNEVINNFLEKLRDGSGQKTS